VHQPLVLSEQSLPRFVLCSTWRPSRPAATAFRQHRRRSARPRCSMAAYPLGRSRRHGHRHFSAIGSRPSASRIAMVSTLLAAPSPVAAPPTAAAPPLAAAPPKATAQTLAAVAFAVVVAFRCPHQQLLARHCRCGAVVWAAIAQSSRRRHRRCRATRRGGRSLALTEWPLQRRCQTCRPCSRRTSSARFARLFSRRWLTPSSRRSRPRSMPPLCRVSA